MRRWEEMGTEAMLNRLPETLVPRMGLQLLVAHTEYLSAGAQRPCSVELDDQEEEEEEEED